MSMGNRRFGGLSSSGFTLKDAITQILHQSPLLMSPQQDNQKLPQNPLHLKKSLQIAEVVTPPSQSF